MPLHTCRGALTLTPASSQSHPPHQCIAGGVHMEDGYLRDCRNTAHTGYSKLETAGFLNACAFSSASRRRGSRRRGPGRPGYFLRISGCSGSRQGEGPHGCSPQTWGTG